MIALLDRWQSLFTVNATRLDLLPIWHQIRLRRFEFILIALESDRLRWFDVMEKKDQLLLKIMPKPRPAYFRFLAQVELEGLSQLEKQEYAVRAYKELKRIRKRDD